ncbi:hypothetical protein ATANTOWER_018871 [Ataeniobius toweri]|uniref:Uncharacterized protein n=1 Tax=Ataeniobius toweri TaxID=208326 RepID=A0ABU7BQF9_9TELE|nr:hypothetical protein [Ataeniobius toweri]
MPPKKNTGLEEELEEIKKSLNFMSGEITKVATQQEKLLNLMEKVSKQENMVKQKDKKIINLEKTIDDLEQYSRVNDIIIQGLETKHRTYARAVSADREEGEYAPAEELETLEQQIIKFFESRNMAIQSSYIEACHTLPKKDKNARPVTIVRFWNRKHKTELLKQTTKLKGTKVYLNEHLTPKNAEIAKQAHILKKQNKITATLTRNCEVMI